MCSEERVQHSGLHRLREGVRDHGPGRHPRSTWCAGGVADLLDHEGDDVEALIARLAHVGLDVADETLVDAVDLARPLEAEVVNDGEFPLRVIGLSEQLAEPSVDLGALQRGVPLGGEGRFH
eukprot:8728329-Pyramimonas_sp.AAC.1